MYTINREFFLTFKSLQSYIGKLITKIENGDSDISLSTYVMKDGKELFTLLTYSICRSENYNNGGNMTASLKQCLSFSSQVEEGEEVKDTIVSINDDAYTMTDYSEPHLVDQFYHFTFLSSGIDRKYTVSQLREIERRYKRFFSWFSIGWDNHVDCYRIHISHEKGINNVKTIISNINNSISSD